MSRSKSELLRKRRDPIPSGTSSLLDIYSSYVQGLRPGSGGNYTGYCPLHGEVPGRSTPSLSVNVENGLWYCFAGCGGGALKSFLKEVGETRSNIDRTLSKVGPLSPRRGRIKEAEKPGRLVLPEKLLGVFDECPFDLIDAGFDWRILHEHDIGYDKKLDRITFPIRTIDGDLAGIVGRCRDLESGKYRVYTKELRPYGFNIESFRKSDYLWRADKVQSVLSNREGRPDVYVVEGFKAALWLAQAGIETVVALMGSFLSTRQQRQLERFGGRIVLCLDNDSTGRKATEKIGQKLSAVRTLVVPLPEGIHQPDDLTEEELLELCAVPISISEAKTQWHE